MDSGNQVRVADLRREEVAMLAGISAEYYTRLERGNASGASEDVLDGNARALQLDEAERAHLFDLVRSANRARPARSRPSQERVRPTVQRILDAMVTVPAYVRNGRRDILAANPLGYAALLAGLRQRHRNGEHGPVHLLEPRAAEFVDSWEQIANDAVVILRAEAGRDPTTGVSPTWSASCQREVRSSGSAGRPTTSSSTAPAPNCSISRSSVTSPSPTRPSTSPETTASASSSTPPSRSRHHRKRSTCSPAGPRRQANRLSAPHRTAEPPFGVPGPKPGPR
jgi:transcriptional regulator with XRE-family HTH domain